MWISIPPRTNEPSNKIKEETQCFRHCDSARLFCFVVFSFFFYRSVSLLLAFGWYYFFWSILGMLSHCSLYNLYRNFIYFISFLFFNLYFVCVYIYNIICCFIYRCLCFSFIICEMAANNREQGVSGTISFKFCVSVIYLPTNDI